MDFSDPYNSNFSPLAGGTQFTNPPSAANGFHTSDARSTSENLESHPCPHNSCSNCSSYHCNNDDEKFLRAMQEGRNDCRRRLEWIWCCIFEAVPRAHRSDREQVWRSLVNSDDIWSIWEDGDDLNLPPAPIPWQEWYWPCGSEPGNFNFITPIISQKIDLHSKNLCSPKLTLSPPPVPQHTSIHMRLAIILWKTLLATRRVKYPRNPSSVDCEIPSLIPKWWSILPKLVEDNLVIDDPSWDRFRVEQKRRGHTCMEHLPEEKMWLTWITVQTLIGTPTPLDIPLNGENCPQCLTLKKQPFGRSEFVKPHVLAVWGITQNICAEWDHPYEYPDKIWDSHYIFSHYTSHYKSLDLGKSLLNQATLQKVDEWLTDTWSSSNDEFDNSDLRKHVGKTLDHIPYWLEHYLESNEQNLEPHWTETQTAISQISHSKSSVSSESDSVEPASWVSAVSLFTLAKIYGLGPLTAQKFVDVIENTVVGDLLDKAPLLSDTPPSKKFHEALKRSGHTCWSEKSCGPNSSTDLYSSAYSLLLGTSDVPVVGCEERYHRTKCAACHAKYAFHDLSLVLDEELLGPLQSLSDKDKKGKVRRLISKLNYVRYQKSSYGLSLDHNDLMTLTKKLSSLSNLFQYALDNGKDMDLFDVSGKISLGYGPNNGYSDDCDSESDPGEETQISSPSRPERQLPQPVSSHENSTLNFEHLQVEIPAQSFHSLSEDDSSHAYPHNNLNLTATQLLPQAMSWNVTESQNTLLYPPLSSTHFDTTGTPNQVQPPMPNQSGTDYTQSHSRTLEFTDPYTMPVANFDPQENENIFPLQEPVNSTHNIQQSDDFPNTSDVVGPPEGQTLGNTFIPETGTGHNTKPPRPPRVDDMRVDIKKQLISMLESKKIQITGGKLPWRNLFKTLQEHKCKFENWPAGTREPHTQNGIEKAPQDEIKAIYKALVDKEHPLRICRIDGRLGGADRIFISQYPLGSGSGNKRTRDEQGSNIEERESNRSRLGM
ncbi:hypothetical protein K435DRAFT_973803 [Dendrothele bispora CBS 962.96]|uniref:Uncharacterized protein n=1 Tax=Dendrothele bispora (strain CBS 962.96) TaxID=1314807 RepID=A0A4V4HB39_DENBC|nr:hypothetical protein K435DRAFT_973803 [Dendrothele bispora CBS 962.96]